MPTKNRSNYYVGETKNQLRHGFGVYYYENTFFRYEGDWVKGKKHGQGKLIMKDGSYYEGEFKNGEIEGNGFRKWQHTGASYSGEMHQGEMHGYGVINYADGSQYSGEFKNNAREGTGIFKDVDGNEYEGSWFRNKLHGHGMINFVNGESFEGEFVAGKRHGQGVLQFPNGTVYNGQWKADMYNGQGEMTHCSGVVYDGVWVNGKPINQSTQVIIENENLSVTQGEKFDIAVKVVDDDNCPVSLEYGRKFEIVSGFKCPQSKSNQSLLELIEDISAKPITTPFGYEILNHPLVEVPDDVDAGISSESVVIKRGATPINEDNLDSQRSQDSLKQTISYECVETTLPQTKLPIVQTSCEDGYVNFRNLMLPFYPYQKQEADKRRKSKAGGSRNASAVSSSSGEGKVKTSLSQANLTEKGAIIGEYVLIISEITDPPFFGTTLPNFFTKIKVVQPKPTAAVKKSSSRKIA